jgi:hypothetical protein
VSKRGRERGALGDAAAHVGEAARALEAAEQFIRVVREVNAQAIIMRRHRPARTRRRRPAAVHDEDRKFTADSNSSRASSSREMTGAESLQLSCPQVSPAARRAVCT